MFEFTEEYVPLLKEVREVIDKVVEPRAREIEDSDEFPVIWQKSSSRKAICRC